MRMRFLASSFALSFGISQDICGSTRAQHIVDVDAEEAAYEASKSPDTLIWIRALSPNQYKQLDAEYPGRVSGVMQYPALDKQVELLQYIRPKIKAVLIPIPQGVECDLCPQIEELLMKTGIQPIPVVIEQDVNSLRQVARRINEAQALLMLPVATIYGPQQMRYWVALTARHNVPMVGAWTEGQINAGASAGWIVTEEAKEDCRRAYVDHVQKNGVWMKTPCYPKVTYIENRHLLDLIGVTIQSHTHEETK